MASKMRRAVVAGLVLMGAMSAGIVGGNAVAGSVSSGAQKRPSAGELPSPGFARNAKGLTYGADIEAPNPAEGPDLVRVYATNGKVGYVYSKDLNAEPAFASPAEAAKWSADRLAAGPHSIPVFDSDGVTRIGDFNIG